MGSQLHWPACACLRCWDASGAPEHVNFQHLPGETVGSFLAVWDSSGCAEGLACQHPPNEERCAIFRLPWASMCLR